MAHILTAPAAAHLHFPLAIRLRVVWQAWRQHNAEKRDLARFDARELQDVGLTDADRAAIVAAPFWREAASRR